jgi:hypothetical protein
MSRFDQFVQLVQSEALFLCLSRPGNGVRPSAIMSVAIQCPPQILAHNTEGLRFQAQELADWFFGGPDPEWLPEQLMFEEVEELVEEYIDGDDDDDDDDDFEYEFVEEFVES